MIDLLIPAVLGFIVGGTTRNIYDGDRRVVTIVVCATSWLALIAWLFL